MMYVLFFSCLSLFSGDYTQRDFRFIDRDNYECWDTESSVQIPKMIAYTTHYGSMYKITESTGTIQNRFKSQLSDFHYDSSISDIDGFLYDYLLVFKAQKEPDVAAIYTNFVETMHARLIRFYSLIGIHKNEPNNKMLRFYTYDFAPFNRHFESMVDVAKWDSGTLSQLKIMMAAFLDDHKNIAFAAMLKNSLLPAQLPRIDGYDFERKPKQDQKADILCSNYPHLLALFQLGKICYPVNIIRLNEHANLAGKNPGIVLSDENSWIALSPDALKILTYDRKTRALMRMNNFQDNSKKTNEILLVAPGDAHVQHGIFINNDLILLAVLSHNRLCNIVYDTIQKKFWVLPDTIRFQHFLIADESIFSGHYVVGGFSSQDERFSRWVSKKKLSAKDSFSCVADAFSMRQFSLSDAQQITFD